MVKKLATKSSKKPTKKKAPKRRCLKRKPKPKEPDWNAFLLEYAVTGNQSHAARTINVTIGAVVKKRKRDPEFELHVQEAKEQANILQGDDLEKEAFRRAVKGWDEPRYFSNKKTGEIEVCTVKKYSDTLLIFLMKGNNPGKYADRHINENNHSFDASLTGLIKAANDGDLSK